MLYNEMQVEYSCGPHGFFVRAHVPAMEQDEEDATESIPAVDVLWNCEISRMHDRYIQTCDVYTSQGTRIAKGRIHEVTSGEAFAPMPPSFGNCGNFVEVSTIRPRMFNALRHQLKGELRPLIIVIDSRFVVPCIFKEAQLIEFLKEYGASKIIVTEDGLQHIASRVVECSHGFVMHGSSWPPGTVFIKEANPETLALTVFGTSAAQDFVMKSKTKDTLLRFTGKNQQEGRLVFGDCVQLAKSTRLSLQAFDTSETPTFNCSEKAVRWS